QVVARAGFSDKAGALLGKEFFKCRDFCHCAMPAEGNLVEPLELLILIAAGYQDSASQVSGGEERKFRVEEQKGLWRGGGATADGARGVAVGTIESFEDWVAEVATGEDIDTALVVVRFTLAGGPLAFEQRA